MQYDDLDRLIRKDFHDGTFEAWTYTDNGLVATSTDSRGVTMNTYDSRDRLISVTQPDGGYINYTYDTTYKLLTETVTDVLNVTSFDVSYTYDRVGNRLTFGQLFLQPPGRAYYTMWSRRTGTNKNQCLRLVSLFY